MTTSFHHGVKIVQIDNSTRPITTVESSVIGLIGTACQGPVNTPTLIVGDRKQAYEIFGPPGGGFSLPEALDGIFDQIGAMVVVINVADPNKSKHLTEKTSTRLAFDSIGCIKLENRAVSSVSITGPIVFRTRLTGDPGSVTLPSEITNVVVKSSDGNITHTLNTDYTFVNNVITRKTAGSITEDSFLEISYEANLKVDTDYTVNASSGVLQRKSDGAIMPEASVLVGYSFLDANKIGLSDVVGGVETKTITSSEGEEKTIDVYTGVHCLRDAMSEVHVRPRILIAPRFTHQQPLSDGEKQANPVIAELLGIATELRALIVADGPNSKDEDAISYRKFFGSPRLVIVDPWVKVWNTVSNSISEEPSSARYAGAVAKMDNQNGFWWSPSNFEIKGIIGTGRPISYDLGTTNTRANLLNKNEIVTIIRRDGYRFWGNRTCSADPKWAFISVRRTADILNDSIMQAHEWAVDRPINKILLNQVIEGVNSYMRFLTSLGALLGGKCWIDTELNTKENIANGILYFDFDFTPVTPAEQIIFRSQLTNNYIKVLF